MLLNKLRDIFVQIIDLRILRRYSCLQRWYSRLKLSILFYKLLIPTFHGIHIALKFILILQLLIQDSQRSFQSVILKHYITSMAAIIELKFDRGPSYRVFYISCLNLWLFW